MVLRQLCTDHAQPRRSGEGTLRFERLGDLLAVDLFGISQQDDWFTVSVVTNASEEKSTVVLRQRRPGATEITEAKLGLSWPSALYSLAHVALPFPPDDPLYGGPDAGESPGIQLGKLALRGERGVLEIGAADMLRLRWNPFHSYIEERVLGIVQELESTHP